MKNRSRIFCKLMLLSLFLPISMTVHGELAKDPEKDIFVSFRSQREGQEAGALVGTVRNDSANTYSCVQVTFNLSTRFDLRSPGEESRHLGVLVVEVADLGPGESRDYQEELPYPAGIGRKSIKECSNQPGKVEPPNKVEPPGKVRPPGKVKPPGKVEPPNKVELPGKIEPPGKVKPPGDTSPNPPTSDPTCSIAGHVSGQLKWDTLDDRGQPISFTLTHVLMWVPGVSQPVLARVVGRKYVFENVAAGKKYKISLGSFRSEPREEEVSCQPGKIHGGYDFKVVGAPSSS